MLSSTFRCGSQQVSRVLRLQPEIGGMFADGMDIYSLTMWRLTCKTNYAQAVSSLKRSLLKMLGMFVPRPAVVLDFVTRHRSVFGGEFALAFILRDPSLLPAYLDIYSADHDFDPLCSSFLRAPEFRDVVVDHEILEMGALDALRTLESQILQVRTCLGTTIRVHRSYTSSATAPISHASCTALLNFVTEFGFACSHPSLTLRRLSLVADQELPHVPPSDYVIHDRLMRHGISFAFSPIAWTRFRSSVELDTTGTTASPLSPCVPNVGASDGGVGPCATDAPGPGSALPCGYANACGSCLCAVSRAPAPVPPPIVAPSSVPTGVFQEQSRSDTQDETLHTTPSGTPYPSVAAGGTSPAHAVEASVTDDATVAHAIDLDIIVGPGFYHYAGLDDVAPAHGISAWDLVPVSSIERPLYMGEVVYTGGRQAVEQVSATSCAGAIPTQVVDMPHEARIHAATESPGDTTASPRWSAPSYLPTIAYQTQPGGTAGSSPSASSPSPPLATPLVDGGDFDQSGTSYTPLLTGGIHRTLEDGRSASLGPLCPERGERQSTPSSPSAQPVVLPMLTSDGTPAGSREASVELPTSDDTEYSSTHDGTVTDIELPAPEKCFRHIYLCPSQGRFFGDRGSFVDFFDPPDGGEAFCARRAIAPFGPVVIWRVLSTFDCEKGCDLYDDALDIGVAPTPVVLKPNLLLGDFDDD